MGRGLDRVVHALRRPLGVVRRQLRQVPLPVGQVAAERRALRSAHGELGGQILVVGDPLVVRQALPQARVDVLGTNPFDRGITVLSDGRGAGALPAGRWSAVIGTGPRPDPAVLASAAAACRAGGAVFVLDPRGRGRASRLRRLHSP
jgi:hypothetical protein